MVLLTVGNSEGEKRCDARCYNATTPRCECCCSGANHGVGLAGARGNMARMARETFMELDTRPDKVKRSAWDKIAQGELTFDPAPGREN